MIQTIHKVYKIRNKDTGMFSKGGCNSYDIWTKEGKSWSNIGHLKSHLNLFMNYDDKLSNDYPYHNAEIVEVEVNYDMCFKTDVSELMNNILGKKEKERLEYEERQRKWKEDREKQQLAELKVKYETK